MVAGGQCGERHGGRGAGEEMVLHSQQRAQGVLGGQHGGRPTAVKVEEGDVGRAGEGAPCWGGFGSH